MYTISTRFLLSIQKFVMKFVDNFMKLFEFHAILHLTTRKKNELNQKYPIKIWFNKIAEENVIPYPYRVINVLALSFAYRKCFSSTHKPRHTLFSAITVIHTPYLLRCSFSKSVNYNNKLFTLKPITNHLCVTQSFNIVLCRCNGLCIASLISKQFQVMACCGDKNPILTVNITSEW